MATELAFVLINPYTIAKSRTGGVIARYMGRTDLHFVAARMIGPSRRLAEEYANLVRKGDPEHVRTCNLLADYILASYAPDAVTGKPRRVMLLLFEGEDAVSKVWNVTGSSTLRRGSGETIRDTYGDYIVDEHNKVQYFEPAVLVAPTKKRVAASLGLWARYSEKDGGIVTSATDVLKGEHVEKTLVLIKPDNFRFRSARPGNIIDILSLSGLRIVGAKKFCMTVTQAEEFYGPVRQALKKRFKSIGRERVVNALEKELEFKVPEEAVAALCEQLGPRFAEKQFDDIVKFMTGYRASECSEAEKRVVGKEECLALVYEGENAVGIIRSILGPTDPSKASPGSVRREFGSDIMVNAAHASDSPKNAQREIKIINIEEDTISRLMNRYYGRFYSKLTMLAAFEPRRQYEFIMRKIKARLKARKDTKA